MKLILKVLLSFLLGCLFAYLFMTPKLTISDDTGSESHTITQLGSLIISAPGATRNFFSATISASPASASSQSDPHIKTFFDDSYQL